MHRRSPELPVTLQTPEEMMYQENTCWVCWGWNLPLGLHKMCVMENTFWTLEDLITLLLTVSSSRFQNTSQRSPSFLGRQANHHQEWWTYKLEVPCCRRRNIAHSPAPQVNCISRRSKLKAGEKQLCSSHSSPDHLNVFRGTPHSLLMQSLSMQPDGGTTKVCLVS